MSQSSWPGAELASASAIKRAATRQAFVLAVVGGTAAGLTFASFRVPEPITTVVIVLAALGVLVEATVVMIERDRTVQQADKLIEQGFAFDRRADITSVTVAERVAYLNSSKHRIALVRMCQQQLDLASAGESPMGYPQPYISIATLAQNADVLRRIISKLNQGACDPRATLLLERTVLYNSPSPFCGTYEGWRQAQEQFSQNLRAVARRIDEHGGAERPESS